MTGTGGTGGSKGVGDVLLIPPESCVRLDPTDGVRGREAEDRGSGEDGGAWSLLIYDGGTDGGSGRRLGVRIRTLREGLNGAVCLDVLPDGVGEDARLGLVRVGEDMGGGDGDVCLGGGGIDTVDMPASPSHTFSFSNIGRSPLSLFRSGPTNTTTAAPAGAASRTGKAADDEAKFGDSSRIASIDPTSPLLLGAGALSIFPFSPSVCAGAEGASLLILLLLLLLFSLDALCRDVGLRARNVTLRLSRLSWNTGRYCDCGLNPDVAFRLVFSRTLSRSCCMKRSVNP